MKTFIFFNVAIFSLCVYSSCSDKEFNDVSPPIAQEQYNGIVYPLKTISRSILSTFETDWENETYAILQSGDSIVLPWAAHSDANMPVQMRHDIKKEDGWVMLLHTFINTPTTNSDTNYMIFYNQRTSILKLFYYLEENISNNNGFWTIDLCDVNHQLFNHVKELALPIDCNYYNYWLCNNASKKSDLAFRKGWNGFQVQLAYDTTNDAIGTKLNILTHTANITKVNLMGDFDGKSYGTIVSHASSNPFTNIISKTASAFGSAATNYIEEKFGDTTTSRLAIEAITSNIAGTLLKAGVNKILTNLTAGYTKPTTNVSDLSFTTDVSGQLVGGTSFDSSSTIISYSPPFSTSDLGINLGVWNLASTPTIYISPMADRTSDYFNGREYNYKFRGITGYNYDLRINPDLEPYLIKHWVDIDVVRYINKDDSLLLNPISNFDYGTLGQYNSGILFNGPRTLNYIYQGDANGKNKIVEEDMRAIVYAREGLYEKYGFSPMTISVPNEEMYFSGYLKYPMKDTYLKFNLFLVTEFEGKRDTTLHTRTFAPKVEWDPTLYATYSNYTPPAPELEIMTEKDSTIVIK